MSNADGSECWVKLAKDPGDNLNNLLDIDAHRLGWIMSGAAAWTATFISFGLILKHVQYYTMPKQQRYIIRICLMIPIYAIASWLSYIFYQESPYFEAVRTLYEAFVLASFFILLVNYLGDTPTDQRVAMAGKEPRRLKLSMPFCCFTYDPANRHLIWYLKWGILQYVVVEPILTLVTIIAQTRNMYCPESMSPKYANVYIQALNFISVTVAMYALFTLYFTIKEPIEQHRPFFKFLCVKLVVFFSFWQSFLISILSRYNIIKSTQYWTQANIATGLDAILICFEMVVFALLHVKAFDYRVYRPVERRKQTIWRGLVDSLNPMDLLREIWLGVRYLWALITRQSAPVSGTYREETLATQMNIEGGMERAGTLRLNKSSRPHYGHSFSSSGYQQFADDDMAVAMTPTIQHQPASATHMEEGAHATSTAAPQPLPNAAPYH